VEARTISTDSLPPPRRVGRFGAVYTHALYLVDPEGRKRGGLGFTDDGAPTMMLLDSAGTVRVSLVVTPDDAPALYLADGAGRPRLSLRVGADGSLGLRLLDPDERPRAVFGLKGDGAPIIGTLGTQGEELWGFPAPTPSRDTLAAELLGYACADDREGFRIALERAGLLADVETVETGWQAARAEVAKAAPAARGPAPVTS